MSGLEHKQSGPNQSAAILSNGFSALLPVTRQKIVKLCETLKQDKLTPWLCFNSRGGSYVGTTPLVFWNSIVPFLQDAIVRTLDETLESCRARKWEPEPYIRETAMLLQGYLICAIYTYMADIDQRLRGKGYPKSVGRKDVTDEIAEMGKFLNECKDVMIQGINAENKRRVKTLARGEADLPNTIPAKIWAMLCKLYEITLKVIVDAILDRFWPKPQ